jgi:hypothetical protein
MTTYWLSDFCSLFNSLNINPFTGGDKNHKYNSLTRLIIVVTIISALYFKENNVQILLAGLVSIFLSIVIYMLTYNAAELSFNGDMKFKTFEQSRDLIQNELDNSKNVSHEATKKVLEDKIVNRENEVTLNYTPPDTDNKKHVYFLDGNKMPDKIVKTERDSSKYLYAGKQTPGGVVKQHRSLLDKNLSMS